MKYLLKRHASTQRPSAGFTLIEVVLVLAVGSLIFLLAFLAFQQVSINRRDAQRRSDAAKILAEYTNYVANGGKITDFYCFTGTTICGAYPISPAEPADVCVNNSDTFITKFAQPYLCKDGNFTSPSGSNYKVRIVATEPANPGEFSFSTISCSNSFSSSPTVKMKLERGLYCRDLQ